MTKQKASTIVTADSEKGQHAVGLFRTRYNMAKLDEARAQGLNESPEFLEGLDGLIQKWARPVLIPSAWQQAARKAIGKDNIVFAEEIALRRGLVYSLEQLKALEASMPDAKTLRELKASGFALIADPPRSLSLLDVRAVKPETFNTRAGGWYAAEREKWAREETTTLGWTAFRKEVVPGSTSLRWDDQNKLLAAEEYSPNAAELSWFITTMLEVKRARLFTELWARTSSVDADGGRVRLRLDPGGVNVAYWYDSADSGIGLASARKFPRKS